MNYCIPYLAAFSGRFVRVFERGHRSALKRANTNTVNIDAGGLSCPFGEPYVGGSIDMNMTGEQRIAAPRQRVWEALNDPGILRSSIPGCQSLEKGADDRFTATVEVKVGPIGARFKGTVSLLDLNPPNGYTLLLAGSGGVAGSVKGSAKMRLHLQRVLTRRALEVAAKRAGVAA